MKRLYSALTALLAALTVPALALAQQSLQNPLKPEFSTVPNFIAGALKVLVMVALPIITLFVVVAGFMFIAARGNPGKLADARKNFLYVVIGALLIIGAWAIATLIGGTVNQIVGS